MSPPKPLYDALILGTGPAGLSTALALSRVHRTSVIFTTNHYRNKGVSHAHAILTRDHTSPEEIRRLGKEDIFGGRYDDRGCKWIERGVVKIERKDPNGFVAEDEEGEVWEGRTVVMATGVKDLLPELEGYEECWPEGIYQCLFCDGHERSHLPSGVLCYPHFSPMHVKIATMQHIQSLPPGSNPNIAASSDSVPKSKVTMFTNGPLDQSDPATELAVETCAAHGIALDERLVKRLEKIPEKEGQEGGVYVVVKDDKEKAGEEKIRLGFVFNKPRTTVAAKEVIEGLGLELSESPFGQHIKTNPPFNSTSVPGVFAAGDSGTMVTAVATAMYTGGCVGAGVAHYLGDLDDKIALARLRSRKQEEKNGKDQKTVGEMMEKSMDGTGCIEDEVEPAKM